MADDLQVVLEYIEKNKAAVDTAAKNIDDLKAKSEQYTDSQIQAAKEAVAANSKNASSWTELSSAINVGKEAIGAVADVVKETYGEFSKYAEQVRDLSLISGQSAESTSRFIQVLDDYQLSAEDAETATKKLKDNGMVPTIDTLAKLADQYKKIQDPAQKMQFIQDNLGKGGAKWINVLNQSSDVLRQNAAQIDKNLILNDKQISQYERERLVIDEVSDKYQGLKVSIGAYFGQLLLTTDEHAKAIEIMKKNGDEVYRGVEGSQKYKDALKQVQDAEMSKADATRAATDAYQKEAEKIKDAQKALDDMTKTNQDYLSSVADLTNKQDDFNKKQGDLRAQYHDLIAQKAEAIAQYGAESEQVQAINEKLTENSQKQNENATEFEKDTHRRILAMAEEMLSQDGLTKAEADALLKQGEQWGIYSDNAVGALAEVMSKAQGLADAINSIPVSKTVTIQTNFVTNGGYGSASFNENPSSGGSAFHGHAQGGSFMIPMAYGNEGFKMGNGDTASGGEKVTITPRGQTASTGGGVVVNIMLDSATPDPDKVAYQLAPIVKRVLRNAGIDINA